ncbi:MAG: hypothetical protein Q8N56_04655, partial [bacterium]|nr:hypothetical protein [bacterium]
TRVSFWVTRAFSEDSICVPHLLQKALPVRFSERHVGHFIPGDPFRPAGQRISTHEKRVKLNARTALISVTDNSIPKFKPG